MKVQITGKELGQGAIRMLHVLICAKQTSASQISPSLFYLCPQSIILCTFNGRG